MLKKILITGAALVMLGGGCATSTQSANVLPTPAPEAPTQSAMPLQYLDLLRVTAPVTTSNLTSPLTVSGEARGYWYFEASFPVRVLDATSAELGVGIAQAQGDWMTEDYVPFTTTVTFPSQTPGSNGFLVFEKDNPSGLPQNDDSFTVPITF